MKVAIVLLVLLPLAFCNPISDLLHTLQKDIHLDVIKENVNKIAAQIGSDGTEAQCETECHKIATQAILDSGCAFFCKGFQSLVGHFHLG